MDLQAHWDHIYETKKPIQQSWFRPHLETSLELILSATPDRNARILDVGGGESTLVDDLLDRGFRELTVLDISRTAIDVTCERLGERAHRVSWEVGDITVMELPRNHFVVWHDRAVFHFLTEESKRQEYVRWVADAVRPGGHVVIATFGSEGPIKCSGLDVVRYDAKGLHHEFGSRFQLVKHLTEQHHTPLGTTQQFLYCFCKVGS